MIDRQATIELIRKNIAAYEKNVREIRQIECELEAAKSYLENLVNGENKNRAITAMVAAFKVFREKPGASLALSEIVEGMKANGWETTSPKPEAIARETMRRNRQFEKIGRGQYRLAEEYASIVQPTKSQ